MQITITSPFRFAHDGVDVVEYAAGPQEVPDEVADVAISAGWAIAADADTTPADAPARKRK